VAVVEKVAAKHGSKEVAAAYLRQLYSRNGQTIIAKHYYRPRFPEGVPEEYLKRFPNLELFTIDDVFGGWRKAQAKHFEDGGVFDQIYKPK
jgi:sulfate transport system substrate-binding protein